MAKGQPRQEKPTASTTPRPASWPRAALIVLLGLITYANSIPRPFMFDDTFAIVENTTLRELHQTARVLQPDRELPTAGRPLANLSFALNYALGGLDVRGYHAVNLAFHLVCAILIFGVARRTFERSLAAQSLAARAHRTSLLRRRCFGPSIR